MDTPSIIFTGFIGSSGSAVMRWSTGVKRMVPVLMPYSPPSLSTAKVAPRPLVYTAAALGISSRACSKDGSFPSPPNSGAPQAISVPSARMA